MPVPPGPVSPESEAAIRAKYATALIELDYIQQRIVALQDELDVMRARRVEKNKQIKALKEDLP